MMSPPPPPSQNPMMMMSPTSHHQYNSFQNQAFSPGPKLQPQFNQQQPQFNQQQPQFFQNQNLPGSYPQFNSTSPPRQQQNVFHYYNNVNFNMNQQPVLSPPSYPQEQQPQQNNKIANPTVTSPNQPKVQNDLFYGGLVDLSCTNNSTTKKSPY